MRRIRVVVTQDDIDQADARRKERFAWLATAQPVQPYTIADHPACPEFLCPGILAIARTLDIPTNLVWVGPFSWSIRETPGVIPDGEEPRRRGRLSNPFIDDIVQAFDNYETVRPGTYYIYEEDKKR